MVGYTEMLIEDITLPPNVHEMLKGISKAQNAARDHGLNVRHRADRYAYLANPPHTCRYRNSGQGGGCERMVQSFMERKQTLIINIPPLLWCGQTRIF